MSHETLSFEAIRSQLDPAIQAVLQPSPYRIPTQAMPAVAERIAVNTTAVMPELAAPSAPVASANESDKLSIEAIRSQLDPAIQAVLQPSPYRIPTQAMPAVAERIAVNTTAVMPELAAPSAPVASANESDKLSIEAIRSQLDPAIQAVLNPGRGIQAPQVITEAPSAPTVTSADRAGDWLDGLSARNLGWVEDNKPDRGTAEDLKGSFKRVAGAVGCFALVFLGVTAGLIGYSEFPPRTGTSAQPKTEEVTTTLPPVPTTITVAPAPIIPETTTTTAPAPEPPFTPKPGEPVGKFVLPDALCGAEVYIGEYSEIEDVNHVTGTGAGFIDQKIPDDTPDTGCDARTQREQERESETHTDFIGRPDRVRNGIYTSQNPTADGSSIGPGNPGGNANYWLPVAGHVTSVQGEGIYTSVLPGNPGNSVFSGHGSTFGAGFGDVALLKIGDRGEFERADGKNFHYEVIGKEVIPADQYDKIIKYSNPDLGPDAATASIFYCTGTKNGDPGTGDAYRAVVRVVFTQAN